MKIFSPNALSVHILHQNISAKRQKVVLIESLCYEPCMLDWIEIEIFIKCVGKFYSQWEFDFPFSDLSTIFSPSESQRLF
jgi:hypothetical protein